jgi:molybdate transport system substrate-binding protein
MCPGAPPRNHVTPACARTILCVVALLAASAVKVRAEELRVVAAGATESTLREVVGSFEARSGLEVVLRFGAVGALRDRIASGEAVDVAILTPAVLEELEAKALVGRGSRVDLGRVGGGIAVRRGEPTPDVSSPEALRQALLAADEIYYADPRTATAGAYLLAVAEKLGVGEAVRAKGRTAPGGKEAMQRLAASKVRAIGVTQVSEILSVKEVVLVGPYPAGLQRTTSYAGVVLPSARPPKAALDFLHFLSSPSVKARFRQHGFEVD